MVFSIFVSSAFILAVVVHRSVDHVLVVLLLQLLLLKLMLLKFLLLSLSELEADKLVTALKSDGDGGVQRLGSGGLVVELLQGRPGVPLLRQVWLLDAAK